MQINIHGSNLLSLVIATDCLDAAFEHAYNYSAKDHHSNDIWAVSLHWPKHRIGTALFSSFYQLSRLICRPYRFQLLSSYISYPQKLPTISSDKWVNVKAVG